MSFRNRLAALPLALLASASLGLPRPAAAQYTLTDLGSDLYNVLGLNNRGQVLGEVNNQYYLVTNGVRQFVSDAPEYSSRGYSGVYLNQKGQVAGGDKAGNIFLYCNGIKQIITSSGQGYIAGLNDNGEVVWGGLPYIPVKYPDGSNGIIYTIYAYQNGVTKNLSFHSAQGINNAGQIAGGNEFYSDGVWKTLPQQVGDAAYINNNGQILTYLSQYVGQDSYGFPLDTAIIGIYTIATNTAITVDSVGYTQNIRAPYITAFNDRGDYVGAKFYPSVSSSNASSAYCYLNGKIREFGYVSLYPGAPSESYSAALSLNIKGQVLYRSNGSLDIYDPMTDASSSLPVQYSPFSGNLINDRGQITGPYTLATPAALLPADSVYGLVTLDSLAANAAAQPVTFEFRNAASGQALFTRTASVDASGAFTVSNVAPGYYTVWVKGPKNLAQIVSVTKVSGAAGGISVFLPGGDGNNDNSVDSSDFGLLIGAYGSDATVPGSGYDPAADFNNDGFVDSTDFGILIGNYGEAGAN